MTNVSLIESVVGNLLGGGGATGSPMGGVLMKLLDGAGSSASGAGDASSGGAMAGGIGALVSRFEQAGIGDVAHSWVGNGPNQAVSPQQLQGVFGQDQVQGMADQAGMEPHDFLSQLSQHLPNAVHGATPDGQLAQ